MILCVSSLKPLKSLKALKGLANGNWQSLMASGVAGHVEGSGLRLTLAHQRLKNIGAFVDHVE
jgi:hypothetical protein